MKRVCVFCASVDGARPSYSRAAAELGTLLARQGAELVYGGGSVGLMGAIADACLAAGGHVIGVIPKFLMEKELGHAGIQDLRVVDSMHARKALIADLSDGFIAMPGGFGTLEEVAEVLAWGKLGLHHKPCGLLNVDGYYDHLLRFLDHAVDEKLIRPKDRSLIHAAASPAALLDAMTSAHPAREEKWIDPRQT